MKQPEEWDQPESGESLEEFEGYLTQAMRRVDAPKGFAERTMARAQASGSSRGKLLTMASRMRAWTSGAIAATLIAGFFVGNQVHVRRDREKAEIAQQQFEAAMRITGETLEQTRQQLHQAGVRIGD